MKPCWVKCKNCEDFYCIECDTHVADCDCPSLEVWMENDVYPWINEDINDDIVYNC